MPVWLARLLANWREGKFRRETARTPPRITQAQLKFAGLNLDFSIAKARTKLGYTPRVLVQRRDEAGDSSGIGGRSQRS